MAKADGSIIVDTHIETDGFEISSRKIESSAKKSAKSVSSIGKSSATAIQKQVNAMNALQLQYKQQEQKVDALKAKIKEVGEQKIPTDEFKEIEKQIDADTVKLNRLVKQQEQFLELGGDSKTTAYKKRQLEIEELRKSIEQATADQEELLNSGGAYQKIDTSALESKLATEQEKLALLNSKLGVSHDVLQAKMEQTEVKTSRLIDVKTKLKQITGQLVNGLKKLGSSFGRLTRNSNKSNASMAKMLVTSLIFSTVFKAISLVTNGITTGFENLAQVSKETNKSISDLKSSLTYLKNAFASAFAPILNFVAPALTYFVNMLAKAVTYLGMFFAALSGQESFKKAVYAQEDYAASLADTTKNAKDAKKSLQSYLSPLDEISKYNSQSQDVDIDTSYKAPTPGEMFETVAIESKIKNFANQIKQLINEQDWDGIGNLFAQKINGIIASVDWNAMGVNLGNGINALVYILLALILGIDWTLLGTSFASGLNGIFTSVDWIALGSLLGSYFMIPWQMLLAFVNELDWIQIGQSFANGLNGALNSVDTNIIGQAIFGLVQGILLMILTMAEEVDWALLGQKITGLLSAIDWGTLGKTLFGAGEALLSGLFEAFRQLPDWVVATIGVVAIILGGIPAIIAMVVALAIANWSKIEPYFSMFIEFIKGIFVTDFGKYLGKTGDYLTAFLDRVEYAILGAKNLFSGLITFLAGVFTGDWSKAWEGIKDMFKGTLEILAAITPGPINGIIYIFNKLVDAVEQGLNWLISGVNKISFDIPEWIPGFGGKHFGLNLKPVSFGSLPYLASGAVIPPRSEFLAVLGDQKRGTNIEAPLETIEQALRNVLREKGGQTQGSGTYHFTAQINRRTLFDEFIAEAKMRQMQTGKNPLEI